MLYHQQGDHNVKSATAARTGDQSSTGTDLRGPVGHGGHRQVPARGIEAAQVAVPGGGAEHVSGDDQARSVHHPGRNGVAQVDRGELRIHAAQVAQRGEAEVEIPAGQREPVERLGGRGLQRLPSKVSGVHGQVDMGVDEPGADRAIGQVDHVGAVGPPERPAHLHDHAVAHGDLGPACELR